MQAVPAAAFHLNEFSQVKSVIGSSIISCDTDDRTDRSLEGKALGVSGMMGFIHFAYWAAFILATFATAPAVAQDYPARPVTIVVPFAAGGGTDIIARLLAQKLEQRLGKSFLIDNKPGAGSTIGAAAAARAAPDGYTLLMAPSPAMAMSVSIYKSLPYNPAIDFIPIALAAQTPFVLIVNPLLPIHSVADLIRVAKEKPLSYGSAGPGTPHHLYAELFRSMTGVEMSHVPYRGSGPLVNDVVGGHLPLTFVDIPPAVGVIQTGKVRAIAISTKTRLASFPDVPAVAETVPGFDAASWQMLVAPAKTPRPIVEKLHAEVKAFLPELTERFLSDGMLMMDNTSVEALQEFVRSEIARWEPVVRKARLTGTQ
jgi:tripartite-type tricarboxylate transporter receptor subunit TctC